MAYRLSRKARIFTSIFIAIVLGIQGLYSAVRRDGVADIFSLGIPAIIGTILPYVFGAFILYWTLGIQRKPSNFTFSKFLAKRKQSSTVDDWAFVQAASEIENGIQEKAVWGRALAESNGDDNSAKSAYIRLRVDRLVADKLLTEPISVFNEDEESIRSRRFSKFGWIGLTAFFVVAMVTLFAVNSSKKQKEQENEESQAQKELKRSGSSTKFVDPDSNPFLKKSTDDDYSSFSTVVESGNPLLKKHSEFTPPKENSVLSEQKKLEITSSIEQKGSDVIRLVTAGMTKKEVISLVGKPRSIEKDWSKQGDDFEQDRWNYGSIWVYFDHGLVSFTPTK